MVVKTFMDMDQDSEDEKQQYLPLALHLASEFFLRNPNKDVRLLVACCLADIFRIYAPEAPYTSHDKLKVKMLYKIKAFFLPGSLTGVGGWGDTHTPLPARTCVHTPTPPHAPKKKKLQKQTKKNTQLKENFLTRIYTDVQFYLRDVALVLWVSVVLQGPEMCKGTPDNQYLC